MALDREFSWRRCIAWTFAIGLHVLILVPMSVPPGHDAGQAIAETVPPTWEDRERYVAIDVPTPRARSRGERASMDRARRVRRADTARIPDTASNADVGVVEQAAPIARPLVYLDDEARAKLPHEPLYSAEAPTRDGDWHTPGDGSEDDVFYRPLALEPNTTRFEKVWRPTGTLGSEVYERLVRATTAKVRVPLNPKFSLVCGASIAGLGGACVIVRDGGSGIIVERAPPAPWERSNRVQCRALRDALAAAADADRVAFLLDRLTALCSRPDADTDTDASPRP